MFTKRVKLFRLLGFEVYIDASWLLIAFLIVWSLSVGYFPLQLPGLSPLIYWAMGIFGAIGLFLSIILHELCHSLVARKYGLPMKSITLFLFGGVAEMHEEPANPKVELWMAAAGPAFSIFFSGLLFAIYYATLPIPLPASIASVIFYLAFINLILAIFNLIPAFPLDGGRVLRSLIWMKKKNLREATRMASKSGQIFGLILIALGILTLFTGNLISAMWWVLIGLFIRGAASASYQQVLTREALAGESIERFMTKEIIAVPPHISLQDFIEHYVYPHHHRLYPVMKNDELVGCINTQNLKKISRSEWATTSIQAIMEPCSETNTISPEIDAMNAMAKMQQTQNSRLLVTDSNHVVGIITLKDILHFLSVKLDLEGIEIPGSLRV